MKLTASTIQACSPTRCCLVSALNVSKSLKNSWARGPGAASYRTDVTSLLRTGESWLLVAIFSLNSGGEMITLF
jgi:hypothetical protein